MTPNTPMTELSEWQGARKAFLALDTKDVRQSSETHLALNRLAAAEDALFTASQSLRAPAGEAVAWECVDANGDVHLTRSKAEADAWDRTENFVRALYASPPSEGVKVTHRHKKRGTEYVLIGVGKMQAEGWYLSSYVDANGDEVDDPQQAVDMREVAIYRSATDPTEIWVRPREEFEDGRFEAIEPTP